MTREPTGTGWTKLLTTLGVPTFLLLWLFGAFPFLPSPVTSRIDAVAAAVERHDRMAAEAGFVLRLICDAQWRGDVERQKLCWPRP